ncbi:hypothetical protein Ngar_c08730 [Candidatus Nitrososphaera gargensis Ga9.2]|uniref:Uncharacterized protein n=1 Tax=Nitrososphaera gargensis (strain Ga9.2) TaxID=1237085 RepID=K0IDN7_NITGG|nr:DUF11 domain-containing protein [Candidatus Nitrososphaera gargensis]AFU57815.1 hypothetical protein Ngar_c08730 [Candidatus Nitrososphaera gargensis Ga9.2]
MRFRKTPVAIMLAVLAGGIISQIPSALGDNSDNNPFGALWDAIFDLQIKDKNLQAQIDELRAERDDGLSSAQTDEPVALASDAYARIRVESAAEGDGQSIVYITAGNNGPDRAAGIKLTTFYLMQLFQINSIDSGGDGLCEDKSRGIIECTLGTLEAGQESLITIHATAKEYGKANTWTVDISTTTKDTDYTNNHVTYDFETGSAATPIKQQQILPPAEQQQQPPTESGIDEPQESEPEQNGLDNNNSSNSTDADTSSEQTADNDSANQTSAETVPSTGSNGTGTEEGNSSEEEASKEEQTASSSSSSEESNVEGSGSSSNSSSDEGSEEPVSNNNGSG